MSVRLEHITKVFTDQDDHTKKFTAVSDVNIEIREGEMVTFLGPSGCGKTTTLRMISGFERPTEGNVYIDGELVNDIPANKRNTSMVFQSYAIFPHMSVRDNIGFGLELKHHKKSEIAKEVDEIMHTMGLTDLGNRQPNQLSGGQQQRVALARAIVNKPHVLLFDEPLSNLDAKLREQMRTEIRRIQKKFGITSIYVTHDQIEAMTVSDRIMIMDKGIMQQIGTPIEVYSKPANHFVANFIGRANFLQSHVFEKQGDGVVLELSGKHLFFPSALEGLKEGDAAEVVIRPEGLELNATKESLFQGTVTSAVYLGATMEYEIKLDDLDIMIFAVSNNPIKEGFFKEGDRIHIGFDPVSAYVIRP
ncbi:MAG: ABC transporter ATP-binding protein [Spirochaetia bacterium]|jgi:iron(III) transport system ATP-binding protein|nr:ABC transporter ATP-binding protein [Spirochaetia bacterium]